ncbi:hypothetical protein UXN85_20675 [Enterobacter hormaechei]
MSITLTVGRVYRGRLPRNCSGLVNDRLITYIGWDSVQYDSPSVGMGRHYPTVSKEQFIAWAARDVTDELPKGEWMDYPPPKPPKPLRLTNAQVFTLRSLNSGIAFMARGDGKKGSERRPTITVESGEWYHSADHVNAPSIPVLMRLGLVGFTGSNPGDTRYGDVQLTEKGREALATATVSTEGAKA